jgi:hypothetical protein
MSMLTDAVDAAKEKLPGTDSPDRYKTVSLDAMQTEAVRTKVAAFVAAVSGATDEEKRRNLPKVAKLVHDATDYVQADLPSGVIRVDGTSVKPLLESVVEEAITALPKPAQEPETP